MHQHHHLPSLRRRKGPKILIKDKKAAPHLIKKSIHDIKLAFSEFYLSLILLQNYQTLNFTGFRKILKKHDKVSVKSVSLHIGYYFQYKMWWYFLAVTTIENLDHCLKRFIVVSLFGLFSCCQPCIMREDWWAINPLNTFLSNFITRSTDLSGELFWCSQCLLLSDISKVYNFSYN